MDTTSSCNVEEDISDSFGDFEESQPPTTTAMIAEHVPGGMILLEADDDDPFAGLDNQPISSIISSSSVPILESSGGGLLLPSMDFYSATTTTTTTVGLVNSEMVPPVEEYAPPPPVVVDNDTDEAEDSRLKRMATAATNAMIGGGIESTMNGGGTEPPTLKSGTEEIITTKHWTSPINSAPTPPDAATGSFSVYNYPGKSDAFGSHVANTITSIAAPTPTTPSSSSGIILEHVQDTSDSFGDFEDAATAESISSSWMMTHSPSMPPSTTISISRIPNNDDMLEPMHSFHTASTDAAPIATTPPPVIVDGSIDLSRNHGIGMETNMDTIDDRQATHNGGAFAGGGFAAVSNGAQPPPLDDDPFAGLDSAGPPSLHHHDSPTSAASTRTVDFPLQNYATTENNLHVVSDGEILNPDGGVDGEGMLSTAHKPIQMRSLTDTGSSDGRILNSGMDNLYLQRDAPNVDAFGDYPSSSLQATEDPFASLNGEGTGTEHLSSDFGLSLEQNYTETHLTTSSEFGVEGRENVQITGSTVKYNDFGVCLDPVLPLVDQTSTPSFQHDNPADFAYNERSDPFGDAIQTDLPMDHFGDMSNGGTAADETCVPGLDGGATQSGLPTPNSLDSMSFVDNEADGGSEQKLGLGSGETIRNGVDSKAPDVSANAESLDLGDDNHDSFGDFEESKPPILTEETRNDGFSPQTNGTVESHSNGRQTESDNNIHLQNPILLAATAEDDLFDTNAKSTSLAQAPSSSNECETYVDADDSFGDFEESHPPARDHISDDLGDAPMHNSSDGPLQSISTAEGSNVSSILAFHIPNKNEVFTVDSHDVAIAAPKDAGVKLQESPVDDAFTDIVPVVDDDFGDFDDAPTVSPELTFVDSFGSFDASPMEPPNMLTTDDFCNFDDVPHDSKVNSDVNSDMAVIVNVDKADSNDDIRDVNAFDKRTVEQEHVPSIVDDGGIDDDDFGDFDEAPSAYANVLVDELSEDATLKQIHSMFPSLFVRYIDGVTSARSSCPSVADTTERPPKSIEDVMVCFVDC